MTPGKQAASSAKHSSASVAAKSNSAVTGGASKLRALQVKFVQQQRDDDEKHRASDFEQSILSNESGKDSEPRRMSEFMQANHPLRQQKRRPDSARPKWIGTF